MSQKYDHIQLILFNITLIIPSNSSGLKLNFFFKNVHVNNVFHEKLFS